MDRYTYDPNGLIKDGGMINYDGEDRWVDTYVDVYAIIDRQRGHADEQAVAFCRNSTDAQLVTEALNRAVRDDARQGPTT